MLITSTLLCTRLLLLGEPIFWGNGLRNLNRAQGCACTDKKNQGIVGFGKNGGNDSTVTRATISGREKPFEEDEGVIRHHDAMIREGKAGVLRIGEAENKGKNPRKVTI
jgi:hypothetical protein